jgi:spermidine synthase
MSYLHISVFMAGAAVMSAEMAAPRLLAPFFGASHTVWTNIIGIILAAMTAGAFAGGRLADKWPYERAYARALLFSGLALAVVPFVSRPFLNYAAAALAKQEAGPFVLSMVSVSLFFAPPVFMLAMISPWAVKLAGSGRPDELGRIAGELSALAALGSIAGTFATSFALLPFLGTRATILSVASLLMITGGMRSFVDEGTGKGEEEGGNGGGNKLKTPAGKGAGALAVKTVFFTACALLPAAGYGPIKSSSGQIYETESPYQYVQVIKDKKGFTLLCLNEGISEHSVLPPSGYLTGGCWDYMSALPLMNTKPGEPLRVLILGLAGGTIARQLEYFYGAGRALTIDGVEIDPAVIDAARRYFGLDGLKRLKVHEADARSFVLAGGAGPYDLIIADAFRQPYIPFHMTTREFYAACLDLLSERGIFAVNFASDRSGGDLADSFAATFKTVFEKVYIFSVPNSSAPFDNLIIAGAKGELNPHATREAAPEPLWPVLEKIKKTWRAPEPHAGSFVFTDDHAPVEFFTERMILRSVFSGNAAVKTKR